MKQMAIQNSIALPIVVRSWHFEIFYDRIGQGLRDKMMTHTLRKCQQITLWYEIWRRDAMYHEPNHYLKW